MFVSWVSVTHDTHTLTPKSLGLDLEDFFFFGTKFALLILWPVKISGGHCGLLRSELFK